MALIALLSGLALSQDAATLSPQAAVEGLLAADRAFSAASARTDLVSGISAMFTADVTMPIPGNTFAVGKTKAVEALQGNTDNLKSRAEWGADPRRCFGRRAARLHVRLHDAAHPRHQYHGAAQVPRLLGEAARRVACRGLQARPPA